MPRWQRAYVCATCAVIGFILAYVLCDFGTWPRLIHYPYDGSFDVAPGPQGGRVGMAYVGMFLWGIGGGLVGGGIGAAVTLVWRRPLPQQAFGLLAAWTLTAFFLGGTYYTWNLWPF
jgi:hypothetical protein